MDIKQAITDRIIDMLEQGGNVGSARWTQSAKGGLPRNGKTGEAYRGVNVLLLWHEAAERGYASNVWLTYKQAEGLGGQVRKGEKSVLCCFFDRIQKRVEVEPVDSEFFLMCKPFWLFNLAQIDGLPESLSTPLDTKAFNPIEEAEQLLAGSGAAIRHGFDGAFYAPAKDQICLPARERFTTTENYYATALHELTHWTGHASRLNRQFGQRFGDEAYAFEELVAELGAAFTVGQLGLVNATIENHAAYVESWIKVLKNDKSAIFTAASQASKASDYIMAGTSSS